MLSPRPSGCGTSSSDHIRNEMAGTARWAPCPPYESQSAQLLADHPPDLGKNGSELIRGRRTALRVGADHAPARLTRATPPRCRRRRPCRCCRSCRRSASLRQARTQAIVAGLAVHHPSAEMFARSLRQHLAEQEATHIARHRAGVVVSFGSPGAERFSSGSLWSSRESMSPLARQNAVRACGPPLRASNRLAQVLSLSSTAALHRSATDIAP